MAKNSINFQSARFLNSLEKRFKVRADLSMFDSDRTLYIKATKWLNEWPKSEKGGIYMWSHKSGTGKSTLAIALAKELIKSGKTEYGCAYINVVKLMESIRVECLAGMSIESIPDVAKMMKCDLTIFDDVGVEKMTQFVSNRWYYMIDLLWQKEKTVIFTSKFTMDYLFDRAEQNVDSEILFSIISRMHQMLEQWELYGVDRRMPIGE